MSDTQQQQQHYAAMGAEVPFESRYVSGGRFGESVRIDDHQHQDLLLTATQVDLKEGDEDPQYDNQYVTQTMVRRVHVPIEKEVEVPIITKKLETNMETQYVRGSRVVPSKKYKDVTETVLETKEEVVNGFRERWVKVKEPTTDIVRKQVPVDRPRKISYIDYEEEVVEEVVQLPKETIKEVEDVRVDKHIGTRVIEIEEDVQYEVRPIYLKHGERRIRETGEVTFHGTAIYGAEIDEHDRHLIEDQERHELDSHSRHFSSLIPRSGHYDGGAQYRTYSQGYARPSDESLIKTQLMSESLHTPRVIDGADKTWRTMESMNQRSTLGSSTSQIKTTPLSPRWTSNVSNVSNASQIQTAVLTGRPAGDGASTPVRGHAGYAVARPGNAPWMLYGAPSHAVVQPRPAFLGNNAHSAHTANVRTSSAPPVRYVTAARPVAPAAPMMMMMHQ